MIDTSLEGFKRYVSGVLCEATADKYARNMTVFLAHMKERNIESFSQFPPNMLSEYTGDLRRRGYSPATIHNHIYSVNRYLSWVRGQGEAMPHMAPAELPRINFRIREILGPEHVKQYLALADQMLEEPSRTAVMLAPCAGLRASELCTLRLDHLRRGSIQIKDEVKKTIILHVVGKGNKERVVPLLDEGAALLTSYLLSWRKLAKGPWLFPSGLSSKRCQTPLTEHTLRTAMIQLREPMQLEFTPHTMRRTYLTTLWRRGVPESVLAKIAGHKDINTLIRHYLSLDPQDILNKMHNAPGGTSLLT